MTAVQPSRVAVELKEQVKLAAPLAAVHAGQQLMSVVDTAIVGRMGALELGAVGMGQAVFSALFVLAMGVMMGLDPLMSQALGAGDGLRARRLMWQGVWLAVVVGAAISVPMLAGPWMLPWMGVPEDTAKATGLYIYGRTAGLIPALIFVAMRAYLQAKGHTTAMLVSMVTANIFNAGAAWLLVFGGASLPQQLSFLHGVPAMGVLGAGLATTLCTLLQLGIVVVAVRRHAPEGMHAGLRMPSRRDLKQAFDVGYPISLQMGAEVGVFSLVGVLAGRLGRDELAGHQVALTVASFSFMVALGAGSAGAVRVGRAVGAKDAVGVRLAGLCSFAFGGGFMALSALSLWVFPGFFAGLLTNQPGVIEVATHLLGVAAVFQLSDGIQAVGSGVLRGAGDTHFLSRVNMAAHYLVGLPVAALLAFHFNLGIMGLWWGLCLGLGVVAVSLFARFWRLSQGLIVPLDHAGSAH